MPNQLLVGPGSGATITCVPPPPPTATFTASPMTITSGQPVLLSWTTSGATSVSLDNNIGAVALSGTQSVSPTVTTTYTLTVTGPGGTITQQVTITVNPGPPTATFTASPMTITSGQPVLLSWTTSGATSVSLDNNIGAVALSGTQSVSPTVTTTYTLTVTGPGGTITQQVTITVNPGPPTATFTASPMTITSGQPVLLSWTTTGATSVSLDNNIGAIALNGTQTVSPTATATYTLTVTGPGGTITPQVTITVNPGPAVASVSPPSFTFMGVQGQTSPLGQTLTISNTVPAGSQNLVWSVSTDSSWLTAGRNFVAPTSGSEVPGGTATPPITVSVDISNLPANSYSGNVILTTNDPNHGTINIPVSLTVGSGSNNALFVSQSPPPASVVAGQSYPVSVTMQNTGTSTWTPGGNYRLGSQNPQDNSTWGVSRVSLDSADSIAPGQSKTFSFTVTAPTTPGSYNFQWGMLQEGVEWFGSYSTNMPILVNVPVPVITSPGNQTGDVGALFTLQISATNNPTSYSASGLPPSGLLAIDAQGLISGTPVPADVGTYTVILNASNSGGFASQVSFNLTIGTGNNAQFVSQTPPPATVVAGQSYSVSVSMQNTGTSTWTPGGNYHLGSQDPQDNTIWTSTNRVYLGATDSIAPGQSKTFTFNVTAPAVAGTYNFQWGMVQDGVEWFGGYSTNISITVMLPTAATPTISPNGGTFTNSVLVTLADAGTQIYYTTDGSAPTTSSTLYSAPFPVIQSTTVRTIAVAAGMNNSQEADAAFTINQSPTITQHPKWAVGSRRP